MTEVVKRCSYGYPQVIKSYPLKDGKPFPTLFWLTCPYLFSEISKIEETGGVRDFELKIESENEFRMKYIKAHESEIEERIKILGNEIDNLKKNISERLKKVGIGGISDFTKVKCLHLHYASKIGGIDNPVGEEVEKILKNNECQNRYCDRIME